MNKIFDFGLYRVGLRRVKVIGLFSALVCVVGSAILPVAEMFTKINSTYTYRVSSGTYAVMLWALIVLAPLIMYHMFSFLTNRRDSDFYHSLPYTRTTMYFSFFAAAMTWIWGILLASVAVCGLLWVVLPFNTIISIKVVYTALINFAVATLCTAAFVPAALSATGTVTSAFLLYISVMFTPKFTVWMFTECLLIHTPILYIPDKWLNYLQFGLFEPYAMMRNNSVCDWASIIYTTVLSLIFVTAGWIIFRKRRSETASVPAPSKGLQVLYRCCITIPLLMCMMYSVFADSVNTLTIVFAVASVLAYYLYELITTKKIRKMLAATKFVWLLPVFCAVFAGGVLLTSSLIYADTPDADKIDHIRIAAYNDDDAILYHKYAETPIDDPEIIASTVKLLKDKSIKSWGRQAMVEITTTSGRKLMRQVRCLEALIYLEDSDKYTDFMNRLYTYYKSKNIDHSISKEYFDFEQTNFIQQEHRLSMNYKEYSEELKPLMDSLLETYINEFNSLTEDERSLLMGYFEIGSDVDYIYTCFSFPADWPYYQYNDNTTFYVIKKYTPESYELLQELFKHYKHSEYIKSHS